MRLSLAVFGAALLAFAATATAQAPERPRTTEAEPPPITMGKRVLSTRVQILPRSTLVITPDSRTYTRAISEWSLESRFPVLIDDGTPQARHAISRFIHGYRPQQILVLDSVGQFEGGRPDPDRINAIVASAWGAQFTQSASERWSELSFTPPGAVVASAADPAWTAALALAADRGQPIIWLDHTPRSLNTVEPEDAATAWRAELRDRLNTLDWSWNTLGDDLNALTVCLTIPTKLRLDNRIMAMTDFLTRNDDHSLWGACGMIVGSEAQAAYTAMSALFLQPRSAWFFDGYEGNFGTEYAVDRPAGFFRQAGFDRIMADPRPSASLQIWRTRQRAGVDAGFIFVNTKGHARWFDLAGARAYGSDVPVLRQPAAVHFIHSFSAQIPANPESIAGRWLDHGAFIYYGAVDEPGLAAFLTPEQAAGRLLTGIPAGFAFRYDNTRVVWKVNYFGDPLFTLGNIAQPAREPIELEGATPLVDRMRTALREQNFETGVAALAMLGRHADVVRICRSLLAERADELTPGLIETALPSLLFEREHATLADVYAKLPRERAALPSNTTILWHALRPELDRVTPDQLSLLRLNIRPESADEDARLLAPALLTAFGENAVRSMYSQLISEADNEQMREKLQRAMP